MKIPIVLIFFNRPQHLKKVFERIADARPSQLFLIADGPRTGNREDEEFCEEARNVVSNTPWPVEVHVNFSQINLGCGRRISSGLDWVFARAPEAIILEDDCVPTPDFFRFCEHMLARYRDDRRIGIVSGDNFVADQLSCSESYYFSKYPHVWGWATWRRTWALVDFHLSRWPAAKAAGVLERVLRCPGTLRFWTHVFDHQYVNHSSWACRLVFASLTNNLLNIIPRQNLVSNIGWGAGATHAHSVNSPLANLATGKLDFPLRHPTFMHCWKEADEVTEATQFTA
jgi:hypothetical protein